MINKKTLNCIMLVSTLVLSAGCSNKVAINDNTNTAHENDSKDNNKQSNLQDEDKPNSSDENSSIDSNNTKPADGSSSTGETTINTSNTTTNLKAEREMLLKIKDMAVNGEIINCEFKAKETNISTVEEEWGEADSTEYIKDAKGTYSDYKDHEVAFGWNKGMQIFEARTFEKSLNIITYSLVEEVFGKPEYTSSFNDDAIVGYTINKDFKILFVFAGGAKDLSNSKLNHYSVLYPAGTVNSMAGDPGRQW